MSASRSTEDRDAPPLAPRDRCSMPAWIDPGYRSTALRGPRQPLVPLPPDLASAPAPRFAWLPAVEAEADLTRTGRCNGEPIGERIIISGRVLDEDGRPVPGTLVELWQANAAGRYRHPVDDHDAPLDPNFLGAGRCRCDDEGRYRFVTIRPGAYPWRNHRNAWRPAHLHFSLFGRHFANRLVTQTYFPGDPLLALDPIYTSVPEPARSRLVASFSLDLTVEGVALGYAFDFVLRGERSTPWEGS
ncbi:MAG: protocatechuate 3,4-dioxygenase subunit beta [Acetobacteraceae bacterium]